MTPAPAQDASPVERRETPRIRLARLVADAAAGCRDVVALDPGAGDRFSTRTGSEVLPGVLVIADGRPGTYDVAIHVKAALTDLHVLADDVREAVRAAAERDGQASLLAGVRVVITDIDDGTGA